MAFEVRQTLLLGPSWTLIPAGNASWQLSKCSEAEFVIVTQSRSIPFPFAVKFRFCYRHEDVPMYEQH